MPTAPMPAGKTARLSAPSKRHGAKAVPLFANRSHAISIRYASRSSATAAKDCTTTVGISVHRPVDTAGKREYASMSRSGNPSSGNSAPNSTKSWMQRPNTWRKNIEQNETQHFRRQSDSLYRRIVDHPPFARRTAQCPETRRLASPGDRYARYGRQQYQNSDIHEQYLVLLLSRPERKNGQGGLSGTLGERPGFRLYGHPAQRAAAGYRPAAH